MSVHPFKERTRMSIAVMLVVGCDCPVGAYLEFVPREGVLCQTRVHVNKHSLLQELLLHSVDEDATRGKQKLSRSRPCLS
jgi:hypothetical protein